MNTRHLFYQYLAQTSPAPLALEIEEAKGVYIYDKSGKRYIDLISGISVSSLGHCHPTITNAIKEQLDKYLHVMVFGEFVQTPQVLLAKALCNELPRSFSSVYFVNSGSEAIEGAVKLAKRHTGRTEIIACKNAYHGSTQGALSIAGDENLKNSYRPLLPDIKQIEFNNKQSLNAISSKTACVVIEPVQGEAGVQLANKEYLVSLREKCIQTGALLIFDEVQTAMRRTGPMFAFEDYDIIPDILVLAKSFGGGMPLGAFVSSKKIMSDLCSNPVLGHITTFGGHPVCCAAALANLNIIKEINSEEILKKEKLFRKKLKHPKIKEFRSKGLLMAIEFEDYETNQKIIQNCISKGVITDWFLFAPNCLRIAPPLIISEDEILEACTAIIEAIENR